MVKETDLERIARLDRGVPGKVDLSLVRNYGFCSPQSALSDTTPPGISTRTYIPDLDRQEGNSEAYR
jgi:hypothetical protein